MPTAKRPLLGALLVSRGVVTQDQVDECLRLQASSPRLKLGQILVRKGYARPVHIKAALLEQSPKPAGNLLLVAFIAMGGLVVVILALAVGVRMFSRGEADPAPVAAEGEPPVPPAGPAGPVDELLRECDRLVRGGRLKEAIDKLDWFPTRDLIGADAARLAEARSGIQKQAADLIETRTVQAEGLARAGRLQEAADCLQELADLALPSAVGEAYQRLRAAAGEWLKSRRQDSHARTTEALAAFEARDAAARPPADPDAAWKKAKELLDQEKWSESLEPLTSLAAHKAWRARALVARAQAHHAAGEAVGVLQDAARLLESGESVDAAVSWLMRAVTRAPIDETVLRLFERLLQKSPNQPRLWEGMSTIWTWRHDIEQASQLYFTASGKGVQFDGPTSDRMVHFLQLRKRGFPAGKPVVVDYAGPYEILTDASPRRARELARQLEAIAAEYAAGFKYAFNPNFRFRVMFFSQDADYQFYHKAVFRMTARERGAIAYYSPAIKQLVVCDSPRDFLETVRHEAYHQFLDYFVDEAPRWFNEGSAAFFEKSTFGTPRADPKYQQGAQHGVRLGILPSLGELVSMPVSQWVGDEREGLFYCQAWSFIYWLHQQGKGSRMDEYLRLLILGRPVETVNTKVFGDLEALEKGWKEAVRTGRYGK